MRERRSSSPPIASMRQNACADALAALSALEPGLSPVSPVECDAGHGGLPPRLPHEKRSHILPRISAFGQGGVRAKRRERRGRQARGRHESPVYLSIG